MDKPPENDDGSPSASGLSIEEALKLPDPSPDPEANIVEGGPSGEPQSPPDFSNIVWPDDAAAPDYAWLGGVADPDAFDLTAATLEALFELGRYQPSRTADVIAFALRGATLVSGHGVTDVKSIAMRPARPDHRHFRCVIGFYFHKAGKLSAFTGSTVPCRAAVWGSVHGGDPSNMLPTGMYAYYVWRHKKLSPALRLSRSANDLESGAMVTVLRNKAGTTLDTRDRFEPSTPYDNVHCSYYLAEKEALGAEFSSWGCLTVRGSQTPSDQWKLVQQMLEGVGMKSRVDLLLSTGKEAAIAVAGGNKVPTLEPVLGALRQGSRGDEVSCAQQALGLETSGFWGADTADSFTGRQRALNEAAGKSAVADGIYGRAADALTGWKVFAPLTG